MWILLLYGTINQIVVSNSEVDNEYQYAFIEATRQQYVGNIVESAKLYHSCLNYNQDDYVVMYKLSKIYASVGKADEAVSFGLDAFKLAPDNVWIRYNIINLYNRTGQYDKAQSILDTVFYSDVTDVMLYKGYAELLMRQAKFKKALAVLEEYEKFDKGLLVIEVHCLNKTNQSNKAIEILNDLSKQYSEDTEILGMLAETYVQNNKLAEAKEIYDRIFYLEPNKPLFWLSYFDYGLQANQQNIIKEFGIKIVEDKRVEIDDKIYVLDKIANFNELKPLRERLIEDLMGQYNTWDENAYRVNSFLVDTDNRKQSVDYLKSMQDDENIDAQYWQSLLFSIDFSQTDTILKYSKLAYLENIKHPFFSWYYAMALKSNKEYYRALSYIDDLNIRQIKNENLQLELFMLKAELHQELENYEEADRNFEAALILDPGNHMLMNNYSYYLSLRNERLDYALSLIEETLKHDKNNFIYLDTYGWILFKMNKTKKAKKVIKKAIRKGGDAHAEILDHYGDILLELDKKKMAIDYWKEALGVATDEKIIEAINEKIDNTD